MKNDFLKTYDYVEGTEFEGLMPAVMDTLGDDYVIGSSDEVVEMHGFKALGSDALEVVSVDAFYKSEGGSEGDSTDTGNTETTGTTETTGSTEGNQGIQG